MEVILQKIVSLLIINISSNILHFQKAQVNV